jgi:hypothetical protein
MAYFPHQVKPRSSSRSSYINVRAAIILKEIAITPSLDSTAGRNSIESIPNFQFVPCDTSADSYFSNFDATFENVFHFSHDLRVFTVTPGINNAPIGNVALTPTTSTSLDIGTGFAYIQSLLNYLNANYSDAASAVHIVS